MTTTIQDGTQPFEQHFDHYIKTYLTERDLSKTAALLAESFCGFGTGLAERCYSREEAIALYAQDIESAPNPIRTHFHNKKLQLTDPDHALVVAELDMETVILEQQIKFNHLRLLMALQRVDNQVEITGMHLSFPTAVHEDDESFPLKELEERAHVLSQMVEERTKTLKYAYDELTGLINRDRLTQLASRYCFEEALGKEQQRFQNFKRDYALMLMDIDDFKTINDTYGHLTGDEILKAVAQILGKLARETDIVARWGGDEFVILMPETELTVAQQLGDVIRQAVAQADYLVAAEITLSIGISGSQAVGDSRDLFQTVDEAMFHAKKSGKNQIVCV